MVLLTFKDYNNVRALQVTRIPDLGYCSFTNAHSSTYVQWSYLPLDMRESNCPLARMADGSKSTDQVQIKQTGWYLVLGHVMFQCDCGHSREVAITVGGLNQAKGYQGNAIVHETQWCGKVGHGVTIDLERTVYLKAGQQLGIAHRAESIENGAGGCGGQPSEIYKNYGSMSTLQVARVDPV